MTQAELATQAWLNRLTPEDLEKAIAYTQGNHWLLFAELGVAWAACAIISRLPTFRPADSWTDRPTERPNLVVGSKALVFLLALSALTFPFSAIVGWHRERTFGLSHQDFADWVVQWLTLAVPSAVIGAGLIVALYALIRRTGSRWWLWATGLTGASLLLITWAAPAVLGPLLNTYTPAPEGDVLDAVSELAAAAGMSTDSIHVYDGSRQSERFTANVSGLFGTARIGLSDTMFQQGASIAEIRAVVAHEIGHYVKHHVLMTLGVYTVLAGLLFILIDRIFRAVRRLIDDGSYSEIADPRHLPILYAIFSVLAFATTPVTSTYSRVIETAADRYALQLSGEPDGLASALIRTAIYRAPSPARLEEILFYSHPSVERRIRRAMEWKHDPS